MAYSASTFACVLSVQNHNYFLWGSLNQGNLIFGDACIIILKLIANEDIFIILKFLNLYSLKIHLYFF